MTCCNKLKDENKKIMFYLNIGLEFHNTLVNGLEALSSETLREKTTC